MDGLELLEIIKCIEVYISKFRPNIVFTHHGGDINIDHQIVHKAVITACRPEPGHCVKTLLFFEVPSSTEWQIQGSLSTFIPNWFVDISEPAADGNSCLEKKLQALMFYKAEMRKWPHPRSLKAVEYMAKNRGSSCGVKAAEAFFLGRKIA
jgi:LmbE family N-acetylglucosaminyl deacetylase